jgi:chaperonin GroES
LRRLHEGEEKVGGIIIPDTAKENPQPAEVIAVGAPRMLESGERVTPTLKVGDKVLLGQWGGTEIKIDGHDFVIVREGDELGVFGA